MKFRSTKLFWVTFLGSVVVVACATGTNATDTATDGLNPLPNTETEPTPPEIKVPPPEPKEPDEQDAGSDGAAPTYERPDASACANLVPGNACVLDPQCGCDRDETCDVIDRRTGKVGCISAGSGALASPCVTPTQCGQGLTCGGGVCRPWCSKDASTCSGANLGVCHDLQDPPGQKVPDAKVCSIACDVNDPGAVCGEGNCVWDPNLRATDCVQSGTKKAYEGCSRLTDCAPGLVCIRVSQFQVECEPWCRVGSREDCGGGVKMCRDVYGAAAPVVDGVKLGHCQ